MTDEEFKKILSNFKKCISVENNNFKYNVEYDGKDKDLLSANKNYKSRLREYSNADLFGELVKRNGEGFENSNYFDLLENEKRFIIKDLNGEEIVSGSIEERFRKTLDAELLIHINRLLGYKKIINWNSEFHLYNTDYEILRSIFDSTVNTLDKFYEIFINYYVIENYVEQVDGFNSKVFVGDYSFSEWLMNDSDIRLSFRKTFYDCYFKREVDKIELYSSSLAINRNLNTHDAFVKADFKEETDVQKAVNLIIGKATSDNDLLSPCEPRQIRSTKLGIIYGTLYVFLVYKEMIKLGYDKIKEILNPRLIKSFRKLDNLIDYMNKREQSNK